MKPLMKTDAQKQARQSHRILRSVAVAVALIGLGFALGFC